MISDRSALPRDTRTLRRMLSEKEVLLIERERIIAETLTSIRRAGASMILTYWAVEAAELFR